MTNKLRQHNRGFTLIETLIAIFVLMLSITGPLTMAAKGLQVTILAKDQDTAFYLAQDAVEYVRWVRDTNKLRGASWLAGLDGTANGHSTVSGSCTGANGCYLNSLSDKITACSGTCPVLNYDTTNNYFTYDSGTASIFTRTVRIVTPVGVNDCTAGHGCEASVIVSVAWYDQGSLLRTVTVSEDMFDWQ